MKLCIGIGEEVSLIPLNLGEYQSGQLGQTVNLLSYDFIGSNPISPTTLVQGLRFKGWIRHWTFKLQTCN